MCSLVVGCVTLILRNPSTENTRSVRFGMGSTTSSCESPALPKDSFHVVIAGWEMDESIDTAYFWDLGLSNARVIIYRRSKPKVPLREWLGPCGMRAEERLLLPNHGRDAAAFYEYAASVYDHPPNAVAFLHGHQALSWHTSCDAIFPRIIQYYRDIVNATILSDLRSNFGMISLTSAKNGAQLDPFKGPNDLRRRLAKGKKDATRGEETKLVCASLIKRLNLKLRGDYNPCCASFIIPGLILRRQALDVYESLFKISMNTSLNDEVVGRFCFEFIIYRLLGPEMTNDRRIAWHSKANSLLGLPSIQKRLSSCHRAERTKDHCPAAFKTMNLCDFRPNIIDLGRIFSPQPE